MKKSIHMIAFLFLLLLVVGCTQTPTETMSCNGMGYTQALDIAFASTCVESLELVAKERSCNENSKTWWIELAPDENGCNPSCVIDTTTQTAEINWRCTGALEPEEEIPEDEETLCPEECPQLSPPSMDWCKDGDRVGSQVDECGCRGAPICLPKENCGEMSLADAWTSALSSECAEELRLTSKDALCNEGTNTWWIELVPDENGCNPACVVDTTTGSAEINWRCTGALVPSS